MCISALLREVEPICKHFKSRLNLLHCKRCPFPDKFSVESLVLSFLIYNGSLYTKEIHSFPVWGVANILPSFSFHFVCGISFVLFFFFPDGLFFIVWILVSTLSLTVGYLISPVVFGDAGPILKDGRCLKCPLECQRPVIQQVQIVSLACGLKGLD